MIVAFSTSSPVASVALIWPDGRVLSSAREAPRQAGGACLELLGELLSLACAEIRDARGFAADLGPGSFTGVRVGVVLAKTFASFLEVPTYGATAFDLIDPSQATFVPSRKGEWAIRVPGSDPYRSTERPAAPALGYGTDDREPTFPDASRFVGLIRSLQRVDPLHLVPSYLMEPGISVPKRADVLPAP